MLKSSECSTSLTKTQNKVGILAWVLIFVIYAYRYTLSPIFGNACRFYPSCSHYAEEALRKYGAFRGSIMAVKRVLRCHPWHEPGYDPVE
ncbi:MAG: membrane protein insertion efficiency factor YidD [candidate division Zixibacteria bacterium]|nr:membrane protein insertion efficiency factor YidD [candidate division Zixibacteria bacterium]